MLYYYIMSKKKLSLESKIKLQQEYNSLWFPKGFRYDLKHKDFINVTLVLIGWLLYLSAAFMTSYVVYNIINNEIISRSVSQGVIEAVKQWPSKDVKKDYDKVVAYNNSLGDMQKRIVGDVVGEDGQLIEKNDKTYMDLLNINHSSAMGVVQIPKISAEITIYHTTSDESLTNGVGHVYGTAFPIGQKGTMSAIAAHSGGVNGLFFTRLHELSVGDTFYIDILGKEDGYKIDTVKVVTPEQVGKTILHTNPNEARITMITCTPIGINTHRLIVSGVKKDVPNEIPPAYEVKDNTLNATIIAITVFLGFIILAIVYKIVKKIKRQQKLKQLAK